MITHMEGAQYLRKLTKPKVHLINISSTNFLDFRIGSYLAMNFLIDGLRFQSLTGKLATIDLLAEPLIALIS